MVPPSLLSNPSSDSAPVAERTCLQSGVVVSPHRSTAFDSRGQTIESVANSPIHMFHSMPKKGMTSATCVFQILEESDPDLTKTRSPRSMSTDRMNAYLDVMSMSLMFSVLYNVSLSEDLFRMFQKTFSILKSLRIKASDMMCVMWRRRLTGKMGPLSWFVELVLPQGVGCSRSKTKIPKAGLVAQGFTQKKDIDTRKHILQLSGQCETSLQLITSFINSICSSHCIYL